jgi:3-deoxy-D-manno-octulosonic-acid transferase
MLLSLYRACSAGFAPVAPSFLLWRAKLRRARLRPEDRLRIGERLGRPSAARPQGRLAWLHSAATGDVATLLPLIDRLTEAGFAVLTTTRDDLSAPLRLPPVALHQFAPLDAPRFVARFLAFWRPDVTLVAGSEFWPNLMGETSRRGIPVVAVNARLSARAFLFWRKFPGAARALLGRLDQCLTASVADNQRFRSLGISQAQTAGDTAYDFAPAPPDATALARLAAGIGARPAWTAFPADAAEEDAVIEAHRKIARNFQDLVTIIAPRNVKRGFDIAQRARRLGLDARVAARTERDDAALPAILVVGDVEAGLLYRATGVIFLGKSLEPPFAISLGPSARGGLNPIEAAKLGCAIVHGPEIGDFADAYAALNAASGCALVYDAETLASEVSMLLLDSAELRAIARAAAAAVDRLGGASSRIMQAIAPYLAHRFVRPGVEDATEI